MREQRSIEGKALADLLDALEGVLAFDWSDNDADAVLAITRLRYAADAYGTVQRLAHPVPHQESQ